MIVGLIHALPAGGEGVTGAHEAEHAAERYRRCFGDGCRRPDGRGCVTDYLVFFRFCVCAFLLDFQFIAGF